jgi:signal peptidase II
VFALLSSAVLFLFIDQWTKKAAQGFEATHYSSGRKPILIRLVQNRNRLYTNASVRRALVGMWAFAAISIITLHSSGMWFKSSLAMAGLGCALAGAAGNLLDIVRRQYVVDFIDFGWWPVFNVADLGIVGGLIVAFWH